MRVDRGRQEVETAHEGTAGRLAPVGSPPISCHGPVARCVYEARKERERAGFFELLTRISSTEICTAASPPNLRVTCFVIMHRASCIPRSLNEVMASKDEKGGVEAWQESLRDTPRALEDMSSAMREAGSAALALQVCTTESVEIMK